MAYSGGQVTQLKSSGQPQAKPEGSFVGKVEADIVAVVDEGSWYPIYKAARVVR